MTSSIKNNSLIVFAIMCFITTLSQAQNAITIHPTSEPIKIDGEINEAIWKQHLKEGNFTQL